MDNVRGKKYAVTAPTVVTYADINFRKRRKRDLTKMDKLVVRRDYQFLRTSKHINKTRKAARNHPPALS